MTTMDLAVQADAAEEFPDTGSCKPASGQPSVSTALISCSAPTGAPTTSPTVDSVLVSCGKDQTQVAVEISTGDNPHTLSFELLNSRSNEVLGKGNFNEGQEIILFPWEKCVDVDTRYKFVIRDNLLANYFVIDLNYPFTQSNSIEGSSLQKIPIGLGVAL